MIRKITQEEFLYLIRKPHNTKLVNDIEEFIRSGDPVCEVVTDGYKTIDSAATCYDACARRMNCGVKVARRGTRVFLVREVL